MATLQLQNIGRWNLVVSERDGISMIELQHGEACLVFYQDELAELRALADLGLFFMQTAETTRKRLENLKPDTEPKDVSQ